MPEVEEVEPLQRRGQAVGLQPARIGAHVFLQALLALAAGQRDALRERFEVDGIAVRAGQAEEQIDGAVQQAREDERALRKEGGFAEEIGRAGAGGLPGGTRRRAVAHDDQQLAAVDLFLQQDGRVGPQAGDLQQVEIEAAVHAREHPVEALGVVRVHHGVHRDLLPGVGHGTRHLQVAQVRADEQCAAPGGDQFVEQCLLREVHAGGRGLAAPRRQLLDAGAREGHHVPEAVAGTGRPGQPAAGMDPREVGLRCAARGPGDRMEVRDDRIEHPADGAGAEQPVGGRHDREAQRAATLGDPRPVRLWQRCLRRGGCGRAAQAARHDPWQPGEHAQAEAGVHPRDAQVVPQHVEMRQAALRVGDPGADVAHRQAGPAEAHDDLDVESHPRGNALRVDECAGGGQGIEPEAAHRIADGERQGLHPHPEVRHVAAVEPLLRHRGVVDGLAAHHGVRMAFAACEEARNVAGVVLAVRIDLQRVAHAVAQRPAHAVHHGGPLALVGRQARQAHLRARGGDGGQRCLRGHVAAVVHDVDGQAVHREPGDRGGDGVPVVVDGDDEAGAERHGLRHGAGSKAMRPEEHCRSPAA